MSRKHDAQDVLERFSSLLSDDSRTRRRALAQKRFTIISNDCWGAEVYKDFGLPYATPLIGTYLMAPCYMALAANATQIISSPLIFKEISRYAEINERRKHHWYPIGELADGVEIQFLHYRSIDEAASKWQRRLGRSYLDRLFFKLSADKDLFTDADLTAFDQMPIRKIAFSASSHLELNSLVTIPNYNVDGKAMYPISLQHFDIVKWLNQ